LTGENASPPHPTQFRLRASAILGVVEQLVVGICGFGVYALVLRRLGADDLGVWSLVLTAATIAQYFSYPNGNTLFHFLTLSESRSDRKQSVAIVETAVVIIIAIYGVICLCGYFPFLVLMRHSIPATKLDLASQLLPAVFASIFLTNLASIYLFALGALHKMYLRSILNTLATLLMFVVTYVLFPDDGLLAAAIGLLSQQVFLLIGGAALVKIHLSELRLITPRFHLAEARGLLTLGAPMQLMTLSLMFSEPFTRLALGFIGTLATISYFTIAWRIVLLLRSFVNSTILTLAPAFGSMSDRDSERRERLQQAALDFVFGVMPIVTAAAIGVSPVASEILFGSYQQELMVFTAMIASGFLWEELSLVFYLRSLGEGKLQWSVFGHLVIASTNVVIGGLLGWKIGAIGAVAGVSFAVGLGGLVILLGNQRMFGVSFWKLATPANLIIALASAAAAAACLAIYFLTRPSLSLWATTALMVLAAGAILLIPMLRHPFIALILKQKPLPNR
jgi:O-antigen/teichoic acid export membrane protein